MLELLAEVLLNGALTLVAELSNQVLRKSLRTLPNTRPLEDALIGISVGFLLGLVSVYFFPTLALRVPAWQWLNALLSPAVAAALLWLWRRQRNNVAGKEVAQSGAVVFFQAFMVGLSFNLSRMLFGH
jgi:hypothetical protein